MPSSAIQNDGIQAFVYLEERGKAKRVDVQTGIRNGAQVEVLEGLSAGAPIVIEGGAFLKDGSAIVRR
ncbi:hypothetical protein D3C86_2126610 [compost metagenome]